MDITDNPVIGRTRSDTDDSESPDSRDDWLQYSQTVISRKLVMLPDKPKSNDARRALNGLSAENKRARRLKLVWIKWILTQCRKYMRHNIEDMICDRAFIMGLRMTRGIIDPGDPDWNNPNLRIRSIAQYTAAITTNSSDALLNMSFQCERAVFRESDGLLRKQLEKQFMDSVGVTYMEKESMEGARATWICTVSSEKYNALTKALRRVQLRKNKRCIRLRHKPPEGQIRNATRNGLNFDASDIIHNNADQTNFENIRATGNDTMDRKVRDLERENRHLLETIEGLKVRIASHS